MVKFCFFVRKNGGYIAGEGIVSNGVVSFDRVNYFKEVDNNLLSASQICEKILTVMFDNWIERRSSVSANASF